MIEVKGVTIDKKWKWIAKDEDGKVYVYSRMPQKQEVVWMLNSVLGGHFRTSLYPIDLNNIPWDQSLHEICHTEDGIVLTPYRPDFAIDDPVMVRNNKEWKWERRHFAKWGVRGELLTWQHGATSFTSLHGFTAKWKYYRLPTPEELNRNANHK